MIRKTIICHLFYADLVNDLLIRLAAISDAQTVHFFNVPENALMATEIIQEIRQHFPHSYILQTPAVGRDIGGKLLLLSLMLRSEIQSDYTLIVHDKKSPHLADGDKWREELYSVFDTGKVKQVFDVFERDNRIGVIGSYRFITNEYVTSNDEFMCTSSAVLKELRKEYAITTDDYDFIAGNIFWIRSDLLSSFFRSRNIWNIHSKLESGNTLDFSNGTRLHAWERIFSWIATSQGYRVYGI